MLIGIGSDHGREIEPPGDLACAKLLGRAVWRYADIAGHVEQLVLRSSLIEPGATALLQEESVGSGVDIGGAMLDQGKEPRSGTIMFCVGLVSLDEPVGELFEVELEDPVLNRTIKHRYSVLEV